MHSRVTAIVRSPTEIDADVRCKQTPSRLQNSKITCDSVPSSPMHSECGSDPTTPTHSCQSLSESSSHPCTPAPLTPTDPAFRNALPPNGSLMLPAHPERHFSAPPRLEKTASFVWPEMCSAPQTGSNGQLSRHCKDCPVGAKKALETQISSVEIDLEFETHSSTPRVAFEESHASSHAPQTNGAMLSVHLPLGLESELAHPYPSVGSKLHAMQKCRPCAWFWKPLGCHNRQLCNYCHICPSEELKARKLTKRRLLRDVKVEVGAHLPSTTISLGSCDQPFVGLPLHPLQKPRLPLLAPPEGADASISLPSLSPISRIIAEAIQFEPDFVANRNAIPPQASHPVGEQDALETQNGPKWANVAFATIAQQKGSSTRKVAIDVACTRPHNPQAKDDMFAVPSLLGSENELSPRYPIVGSESDIMQKCRPCAWFSKPVGCQNGQLCKYCRLRPAGELEAQGLANRPLLRDTTEHGGAPPSLPVISLDSFDQQVYGLPTNPLPQPPLPELALPEGTAPFISLPSIPLGIDNTIQFEFESCARRNGVPARASRVVSEEKALETHEGAVGANVAFETKQQQSDSSTNIIGIDATCKSPHNPQRKDEFFSVPSPLAFEKDFLLRYPSVGSELHDHQKCRPCAWFWKPLGCQNGQLCNYCHLCPPEELKARRLAKRCLLRDIADKARATPSLFLTALDGANRPPEAAAPVILAPSLPLVPFGIVSALQFEPASFPNRTARPPPALRVPLPSRLLQE